MKNISVLPMYVENCIKTLIEEKFQESGLNSAFPNLLLREDVLDLLDRFCTVVYFPLENERNNGFHITHVPLSNGEKKHFVFINTAQTIEKQVFTAAHELGHIWNVDDEVLDQMDMAPTPENRELIINRFAAVLLIPNDIFEDSLSSNYKQLRSADGGITVRNLLKLIVLLMNQFFVPMKAIVLRMVELGNLDNETAAVLLGCGSVPEKDISDLVQNLISEYGFIKFQKPSQKKWIEGLSDLLEEAEVNHLLPQEKIDHMRETFELAAPKPITTEMNNLVSLSTQKGLDS